MAKSRRGGVVTAAARARLRADSRNAGTMPSRSGNATAAPAARRRARRGMEAWVGDMAALCPRMRRVFRMLFSECFTKPVWSSSWRTAFVFSNAPLRLHPWSVARAGPGRVSQKSLHDSGHRRGWAWESAAFRSPRHGPFDWPSYLECGCCLPPHGFRLAPHVPASRSLPSWWTAVRCRSRHPRQGSLSSSGFQRPPGGCGFFSSLSWGRPERVARRTLLPRGLARGCDFGSIAPTPPGGICQPAAVRSCSSWLLTGL